MLKLLPDSAWKAQTGRFTTASESISQNFEVEKAGSGKPMRCVIFMDPGTRFMDQTTSKTNRYQQKKHCANQVLSHRGMHESDPIFRRPHGRSQD